MTKKRALQLMIAAVIGVGAALLLFQLWSALQTQHAHWSNGCWPSEVQIGHDYIDVHLWWREQTQKPPLSNANPIEHYFLRTVRHSILWYMLIFWALIGWSGSVAYRIVQSEGDRTVSLSSWEHFSASLGLASLAGAIIAAITIAKAHLAGSDLACVSWAGVHGVTVTAIAAGLFLTLFFRALERRAGELFNLLFK